MASVLLIFGLGGIAIFGRESADDWGDLTFIGIGATASIGVLWIWRFIDWSETFWEDVTYVRIWQLESELGFLTNLSIHFLLLNDDQLKGDEYWKKLSDENKAQMEAFRRRFSKRPVRMRIVFTWIASLGSMTWVVLFAARAVEFACR